jgi:hypothetical protein
VAQKNFSLAALLPEPITFTDDGEGGSGKTYAVMTTALMNSHDYAKLAKFQDELPKLIAKIAMQDEADMTDMAEMAAILDRLLMLLIPDLSEERVQAIGTGLKMEFVKWWRREVQGAGEPAAGNRKTRRAIESKTPRGKRSPASSTTTA